MNPVPIDSSAPLQAPGLARRFASLVYEVLVLFGVALLNGVIGSVLQAITGDNQDTIARSIAFCVFGFYFVWFWSRQGQTLPMQTWNIRVVTAQGGPLTRRRALLRYVAASLWLAPPALLMWAAHLASPLIGPDTSAGVVGQWVHQVAGWSRWNAVLAFVVWGVIYGLLALLQPQRQFWHDILAGTRLVSTPPRTRAPR